MCEFPFDVFDQRIMDHLASRDLTELRQESGVDSFRPYMGPQARILLTDRTIYMLSLEELRGFPKYLCQLTLHSAMAEIWEDHYQYWAWTGSMSAIAKMLQEQDESYRRMFRLDSEILRDLGVLIHIGLAFKREQNRILQENHDDSHYNPTYEAILINSFRIVNRLGVSTLEGLLRRKCRQTESDGMIREFYRDREEFEQYQNHAGRVYLRDGLRLWHDHEAEVSTENALNDIRHYDANTRETIHALFGEFAEEIESQMDDDEDFFAFLHALRNPTAHSEYVTHSLGSIILNLACLVFWDDFPDGSYDEYRSNLLNAPEEAWNEIPRGHKPSDFYPIRLR